MFIVQLLMTEMIQKPPRRSRCVRSYLVAEDETSPERRFVLHGRVFIHPFLLFYIGLMFLYESVMGLRRHEGQGCILADEMFCLAFPSSACLTSS